ncbi:MAG TPA: AAA family ATPase, partial [Verrucomicrobiae bacterium]|nr:AAA family ATPase [Verrucomicrobiae bacterium]
MPSRDRIVGIQERYPYLFAPVAEVAVGGRGEIQPAQGLDRLLLLTGNILLAYQFREARDDEEMSARVRQYLAEPSRDRLADLHLTVATLRPSWLTLLLGFPEGEPGSASRPTRDELGAALDAYRRLLEARESSFGVNPEMPVDLSGAEGRLARVLTSGLDLAFRRTEECDGTGLELVRADLSLNLFPFCLADGDTGLLLFASCGSGGPAYVSATDGSDAARPEPPIASSLAEVYLSLGQYARAKAVLSELRDRGVIGPDDATLLAATYALYGFRCYQKADFEKSAQCFEQSLKLRPDLVRSYYQLCLAYTKKGEPDRAIDSLHRLADKYPKQRKTYELLGDLFCEQENYAKALLMYDRAVSLEPVPSFIERKRDRVREKIDEVRRAPREALARARVKGPARLAEFLSDMTREAELGLYFPIVGRDAEIAEMIEILCCRDKRNPLLVGEAGVGKSALVEELNLRIAEGRVPAALAAKRVYLMSISTILAGAKFRGQFEERFLDLIKDLRDENSILFIDNIQTVIAAGSARGGGLDAAALLKPALVKGEIQVVGTTTYDEYQANIEKDPSLTRCFQLVRVEEPDLDAMRLILIGSIPRYEAFHDVTVDAGGLARALPTMRRAMREGSFPDRALDILDRACARVALARGGAARGEDDPPPNVTEDDLLAAVAGIARVPQPRLAASADTRLQEIEGALRRRVVGQEEAVSAVARLLRTAARGLKIHPRRPNGVFLFVGPTGVGKTELAR